MVNSFSFNDNVNDNLFFDHESHESTRIFNVTQNAQIYYLLCLKAREIAESAERFSTKTQKTLVRAACSLSIGL